MVPSAPLPPRALWRFCIQRCTVHPSPVSSTAASSGSSCLSGRDRCDLARHFDPQYFLTRTGVTSVNLSQHSPRNDGNGALTWLG
jgi:hypothetical protein